MTESATMHAACAGRGNAWDAAPTAKKRAIVRLYRALPNHCNGRCMHARNLLTVILPMHVITHVESICIHSTKYSSSVQSKHCGFQVVIVEQEISCIYFKLCLMFSLTNFLITQLNTTSCTSCRYIHLVLYTTVVHTLMEVCQKNKTVLK